MDTCDICTLPFALHYGHEPCAEHARRVPLSEGQIIAGSTPVLALEPTYPDLVHLSHEELEAEVAALRHTINAMRADLAKVRGHRHELAERCFRKDLELDELRAGGAGASVIALRAVAAAARAVSYEHDQHGEPSDAQDALAAALAALDADVRSGEV